MKTTKNAPAATVSAPAAKKSAPFVANPPAKDIYVPGTPVTPAPRLGKAGIAVLTALVKNGPLTRPELTIATGIKSGFVSLLGPATNIPAEPSSLAYKGFITIGTVEGKSSSVAIITEKGRAALTAATASVIPAATVSAPEAVAKPAKPAAKKPAKK